jgi:SAM-dependent methyltransferase
MRRPTPWDFLSPSSTLLKFAGELSATSGALTLDLACGFGRNAIVLAAYGNNVVCVDNDLNRLCHLEASKLALLARSPIQHQGGLITTICADIGEASWPFATEAFHVIICVHFKFLPLMPCLIQSLRPGGYLYLETFGGQGENYRHLPRRGETKLMVGDQTEIRYYRENPASRKHGEVVTVKVLARKL